MGIFEKLKQGLKKTKQLLNTDIRDLFKTQGGLVDDEFLKEVYEALIKTHRAEYINERDSATIKSWGLNSVRIPVPYFIFGDRAPFIGCIDELDKAFN